MKKVVGYFLVALVIASCSSEVEDSKVDGITPEYLLEQINVMDDSLNVLMEKVMKEPNAKIDRLVYHEAAMRNITFYQTFPDHELAPEAIEKAASMYMAIGLDERATEWRDSLLLHYPDYSNILTILELQKSFYDNFDRYEPKMIQKYCDMMLDLGDALDSNKRKDIEFRLEHIDLSFIDLIKMQNPDLEL